MKRFSYVSMVVAALISASPTIMHVAQAQELPDCEDRVTGGGWIVPAENQYANFGAGGGIHQGELWGYLTYVDHSSSPPMVVSAQEVTGYCQIDCSPTGSECRRISYANANIRIGNEVSVCDVQVEVCDSGEPGVADTFNICIQCIGYCAGGILGGDDKPSGGNVQLHQPDPTCESAIAVCSDLDEECPCFLDCFIE
jgi:hypothetical protein